MKQGHYLTPSLDLRDLCDNAGPLWETLAPVGFERPNGDEVWVPTGTITDLASIPRALWIILPPIGSYDRAAVLHDEAYKHGGISGKLCTRAEADTLLNEAMIAKGVTPWKRRMIYAGVRLGGWCTWNKYRQREVIERKTGV